MVTITEIIGNIREVVVKEGLKKDSAWMREKK